MTGILSKPQYNESFNAMKLGSGGLQDLFLTFVA